MAAGRRAAGVLAVTMRPQPAGFVTLVRRNIILAEDQAAFRELARPCPCDGCPLRPRCAAEQIACKVFVAYVHNPSAQSWRNRKLRRPTRELYADAMGSACPGYLRNKRQPEQKERVQAHMDALAREYLGTEIHGRKVVAVERRKAPHGYPRIVFRLHCPKCGKDAVCEVATLLREGRRVCRCVARAERTERTLTRMRDEFVGKDLGGGWHGVGVDMGAKNKSYVTMRHDSGATRRRVAYEVRKGIGMHPPGSNHAGQRAWRAQREAEIAERRALDAHTHDAEQRTPCEP